MTRTKRAASVIAFTVLLSSALTGTAFAQFSTPDDGVTITPGGENCNGIIPTPGSENTVKTLVGGDLVPGGSAMFRISYPVDEDHIGDEWEIVDCFLLGTGSDLKDYEVIEQATFDGVINSTAFELNIVVSIPADAPIGSTLCNVAKTTEGPSAPQSSNRKAGPACFVIGGAAQVEKRSTEDPDGNPIPGATFEVSDCDNAAPDPDLQPLFVSNAEGSVLIEEGDTVEVVATEGWIGLDGPAGSSCTVTEVAPPPGYLLPDTEDLSQVVTIPVGGTTVAPFVFLDPPIVPAIRVTKTCSGSAGIGDEITYEITVRNTGNEELTGLTVDDSLLGDLSGSFPDSLDVGQSVTREFTHTVTADDPDPLPNHVEAAATGAVTDRAVDDDADCSSDIVHEPGITVSKSCAANALVGEEVTYTITVRNTGDEPLEGVTVVDSLLGDISNLFANTLDVGASETEEVTRVVLPGEDPVNNTVTASGSGTDSGDTVTDEASCSSDVLLPDVRIIKDGPDLAHVGDTVTYSFTVTNTGETALENVTITDPLCDPGTLTEFEGDENDNGLLDLEETWTASCTHEVAAADGDPVPNTAVVDAEDESGNPVSDEDDHLVDIIHPDILVVKTASVESGGPGDEVTYTYVVTNTGDTMLFDISVDDDVLGHIGDIESLEPGASRTLTADGILPEQATDLTNVVDVCGSDELGLEVCDRDQVTVSVVLAGPPILPETGTDLGGAGFAGFLLVLLGSVMVAGSARRPSPAVPAGIPSTHQLGAAAVLVLLQAQGRSALTRARSRARGGGRDPDRDPPTRTGP